MLEIKDDVPVTGAFLSLVKILENSRARYIAESNLAEELGRPEPKDWLERCMALFHDEFSEEFKLAGLRLSSITFSSLMDLKIDDEVLKTPISDLPKKFVFNHWIDQGKGGIKNISSKC